MAAVLRIGIVGGGPGGLFTAYHLQKYAHFPLEIAVFEASPRLGGKIQTLTFSQENVTYEAGAAEIYDYSETDDDHLKDLIHELGLSIMKMEGSAVIMNQQLLANMDDVRQYLGPVAAEALLEFHQRAIDCQTPTEFYWSDRSVATFATTPKQAFREFIDQTPDPATIRFIETLIHSDLATEPTKTNLDYGVQNYVMNHPKYMQLYSVVGGNEQITVELAKRIQAEWLLNQSVTEVGRGQNGLEVTTADGTCRVFDVVVIALPTAAFPSIRFRGDQLSAAVARHFAHHDHPAHYLRITILFKTPFWRGAFPDSFCMLDQFGGCCLYDESLRQPGCPYGILGWLIAGDAAETMCDWPDEQLIEAALASLPEFLATGRDLFIEGRIHRWQGAVNAMPGGRSYLPVDRRHQPEPTEHPHLFFVGDYLYDSTLNGVLESADEVAQWIASMQHDRSRSTT